MASVFYLTDRNGLWRQIVDRSRVFMRKMNNFPWDNDYLPVAMLKEFSSWEEWPEHPSFTIGGRGVIRWFTISV